MEFSSKQTPAGFPEKGLLEKESKIAIATCAINMLVEVPQNDVKNGLG
jgi:hypothetical protein